MKDSQFTAKLYEYNKNNPTNIPDKRKAQQFIDNLIHWLFPIQLPEHWTNHYIQYQYLKLAFSELLNHSYTQLNQDIYTITEQYWAQIPIIYDQLLDDAKVIYRFDPAAYSLQEVIAAYPGFYAIAVYRLSHQLYLLNIPILPRILSEYAHSQTGIDIHPGAIIGNSFFIDHGTGLVIGETTHIGDNVKIYQGVTLGALNVEKGLAQKKRHPTIENNVILYAGSTVLGGQTVIGANSIIGGNVWLTESVPAHSIVYHKSEIHIRSTNKQPENEVINWVI